MPPLRSLCAGLALLGACTQEPPVATVPPPPVSAAPASLRRILARQYKRSVALLLGDRAAAAANPPADIAYGAFASIAASQLSLSEGDVSRYEISARAVAGLAMENAPRIVELVACVPSTPNDEACFRSFVDRFGRLAFRRPLTQEETADYVGLAVMAANTFSKFESGIELVIATMLQAPSFLYQVEIGEPVAGRSDIRKLNGYELAARMSFLLHDRTPSAPLLDAAAKGELDDEAGVRKWTETLLADAAARIGLRNFFSELLALGDLDSIVKDVSQFPEFSVDLADSMQQETQRFVDQVLWVDEEPLPSLFTADYTFVDAKLAALYGMAKPGLDWEQVTLPEKRKGVLTHASIMARQAHPTMTSATRRGRFVLERFLCTTMDPPPPGVNTTLPPSSVAPTLRERVAVHQTDPMCASCHKMSDGLGLTFETFDAIGRWREKENGASIDTSGTFQGVGAWKDASELSQQLARSESVTSCLLRQAYRYGTGHVDLASERPSLVAVRDKWKAAGFTYRALVTELVASDLFRHIGVSP